MKDAKVLAKLDIGKLYAIFDVDSDERWTRVTYDNGHGATVRIFDKGNIFGEGLDYFKQKSEDLLFRTSRSMIVDFNQRG